MTGPLSEAQVRQWKERGYVVVSGLLDPQLIDTCTGIMTDLFADRACRDFGSEGKCEFPTGSQLDDITVSETLMDAVSQLLDTPHILLTQR